MIEQNISQYIEKQFPAFYHDEGPQFIAFVKAYYEWLEQPDNVIYKARHLLEWRDVDTTLDEFILYFKEKYLKNIQFDTATNKQLLIKNAIDMYRSKGTERSIDLFFKLVYGTDAEVQYPAERIFKLSDGIWEIPKYLEITYDKSNLNYVGRQIIGSKSGATAFVERYIRRRAGYGIVNLLYISNLIGEFDQNETIGVMRSNRAVYSNDNARLVGSVDSVILVDNGRDFQIGDIVSFQDSPRGKGGLARVTEIGEATGLIDFILHDGGWGYTTNAVSIVSEKVLSANGINGNTFPLMDTIVEPMVQITYTDAPIIALGDVVRSYNGANNIANGVVIRITQNAGVNNGIAVVSMRNGPFTTGTYYINSNVATMNATLITDYSAYSEIMGIPTKYDISVSSNSNINVADVIYSTNAYGRVDEIRGNILTISNTIGQFANGSAIGNTVITNVDATLGVYNVNKRLNTINFSSANTPADYLISPYVYQYDAVANVVYVGMSLHSSVSGNGGAIDVINLQGAVSDLLPLYTVGNTSKATVTSVVSNTYGGDYVESANARWMSVQSNVMFSVSSISDGSGAGFDVGVVGETETLYLNTDLINANSVQRERNSRTTLVLSQNTAFAVGDVVYQYGRGRTINASANVDASTGLITFGAATNFQNNSIVRYLCLAGNTVIAGLVNNDVYQVLTGPLANTLYLRTAGGTVINSTTTPGFAVGALPESGHMLHTLQVATVYNVTNATSIDVRDTYSSISTAAVFLAGNGALTNAQQGNLINASNTSMNVSILTNNAITTSEFPANNNHRNQRIRTFSYGFPKLPSANVRTVLYNALTFDTFILGTIDSLSSLDPGADYNVDPYVLVDQAEIAGMDKRDYLISITSPTSSFVIGEKINQTLANLATYTYQVNNAVYGNTFSYRQYNFITEFVSNTADFIYTSNAQYIFNASLSLRANQGFVAINGHSMVAGDTIRYYTEASNTAVMANAGLFTIAFANTTGVVIANSTANVVLTEANVKTFDPSTISNNYISITSNPFPNDTPLRYVADTGNTAIIGLANNIVYYAVASNSTVLRLAATLAGNTIDITTGLSETGHALIKYDAAANGHSIRLYKNDLSNNMQILYTTAGGNTALSGLTNNSGYYVVGANSTGIKLASNVGGVALDLTSSGNTLSNGHYIALRQPILPLTQVYSANNGGTANVISVYSVGSNSFIIVGDLTGNIANGDTLKSNNFAYINTIVLSVSSNTSVRTAKGIVRAANSTTLSIKRIQYDNLFQEGAVITGEVSGAHANIISINYNYDLKQIGLNANVEANVVTADGQATSLQIIDSGYGYINNESVQFVSADGERAGTVKLVIGGSGMGKGYYRSSRGFLSDIISLHDGDYYQEYSYEVFSKLSVDKYADMFKKVMHTAGTKFFGSARVVEEANVVVNVVDSSVTQV